MTGNKGLILVAHPDARILAESYFILASLGYSVATRSSVIETLKLAHLRKPEMVLLGSDMPRFQGTPLARSVRDVSPGSRIFLLADRCEAEVADGDVEGVFPTDLTGVDLAGRLASSAELRVGDRE